jgi:hypothetical protein
MTTSPAPSPAPSPVRTGQLTRRAPHRRRRPDPRWLLTALAFPPAGYVGHLVSGPVDSPAAAVLGGLVTGALLGAAQWGLLRRHGIGPAWIAATAIGLAGGLAAGAALVSYETSLGALAAMGAVSGLGVGMAQARLLGSTGRRVAWSLLTAMVWALGWTVSTSIGIAVEDQFVVFGISGALACAAVQSTVVRSFVPATVAS